jgi:hypothetical protein
MTGDYGRLYRAVMDEAANDGRVVMETIIRATRRALHDRESDAKTIHARQSLTEARQYLNKHELVMVERYAAALRTAFDAGGSPLHPKALDSVHFDQLELMDESQIVARVELARAEQVVVLAVSHSLAEFNPLMCAAAGFSTVRADRNSIRPESYVQALQTVVSLLQLPVSSRDHLMAHLSEALGHTLAGMYANWTTQLRAQGVQAAGYAVRPTATWHDGPNAARSPGAPVASAQDVRLQQLGVVRRTPAVQDESLLTLNKLRQLLSGEFDRLEAEASPLTFAEQFSKDFEVGFSDDNDDDDATDFASTVPAAFEALKEMQQVEQVMARIGTRSVGRSLSMAGGALGETRLKLRKSAKGLGQALSLEVVSLMVENIANDERLLVPIQNVIRNLEPALLRLAMVDPRFFSEKEHPARCLLQEITQRSLAFGAIGSISFDQFFKPLQSILGPLAESPIESAQPFELALIALTGLWDEQRQKRDAQMDAAVLALQRIEDRNLLAAEVVAEITAQPDLRKTPSGVIDFLCGPWAQVIAHATLADKEGSLDPGHYRELVLALVWSAQPELTRQKIGKLTRLVPKLLSKLREGLALIDYPPLKTSMFFELLMNLHQQAFKSSPRVKVALRPDSDLPVLPDITELWVAPAEAKASGFMDAPMELAQARSVPAQLTERLPLLAELEVTPPVSVTPVQVSPELVLPLGAWVELLTNEVWMRTQLSWASPHGTLFLFTSATGSTQSMTRRLRDKLIAAGSMRIISSQAVVDGALDAVVQTAMINSVDVSL